MAIVLMLLALLATLNSEIEKCTSLDLALHQLQSDSMTREGDEPANPEFS